MSRIFTIVFLFVTILTAYGQQENTLHLMRAIPQSSYNNPAFVPRYNTYVGLPGISSIFFTVSNSFSYKDAIRQDAEGKTLKLKSLEGKLKDKNYLNNIESIDLFSLGFRATPRLYFNLNIAAENYQKVKYPKQLLSLIVNGNGNRIGETISMEFEGNSLTYMSTGIGASYQVDDKITVGARFKILGGAVGIKTKSASLDLTTNEDYSITIRPDFHVLTAGMHSKESEDYTPSLSDVSLFSDNRGFAFDIGGTYKINDRITAGLSLTNLGRIKWRDDIYTYKLTKSSNSYTFEGIDLNRLIDGESIDDQLDSIGDELDQAFDMVNDSTGTFNQSLPMRTYLSGTYYLGAQSYVGLVVFGEKFNKSYQAGFTALVNKDFGKRLTLALSYTYVSRSYNNVGAGFALNLPPFQLYFVGDNIVTGPMAYKSIRTANLRFGLNLIFGWNKSETTVPSTVKMLR